MYNVNTCNYDIGYDMTTIVPMFFFYFERRKKAFILFTPFRQCTDLYVNNTEDTLGTPTKKLRKMWK